MIIINTLEHSSPELSRSLDREEGQKDPELKFGSNFLFEGDLSLIFHSKKGFIPQEGGGLLKSAIHFAAEKFPQSREGGIPPSAQLLYPFLVPF